ncbi:MAG: hypothetical protein F9K43_10935 [Bauldia sp.]|nr:MAG: hypothetical protein F9K43_10935 [Bauldia sp.]MBZ0229437.1 hypothetical protein [Bauldia sp.]
MTQEFWVVGGCYRDTSFAAMDAAPEAYGPFARYEDALRSWSDQSTRTRSQASVRYSIVTTASAKARAA